MTLVQRFWFNQASQHQVVPDRLRELTVWVTASNRFLQVPRRGAAWQCAPGLVLNVILLYYPSVEGFNEYDQYCRQRLLLWYLPR